MLSTLIRQAHPIRTSNSLQPSQDQNKAIELPNMPCAPI